MKSEEIREAIAAERRLLQTDLWALLQVLYPQSGGKYWSDSFHGPVCKFFIRKDPDKPIQKQDVLKQRLYLDPRNHFKTTIDICDCVQWILNFPDVRILIGSGKREHAVSMAGAVKSHFQYNPIIRDLFPELCPHKNKVEDFGKMESFTVPGRKDKSLREPTVAIASPDSGVASQHYDVIKFDDLVNETNSRTPEGLKQVTTWFKLTNPLLEPYGYRDVIGTRYDFSDTYGEILGDDFSGDDVLGEYRNGWVVWKRGCFDKDGNPKFPERYSREALDKERREMGTFLFACTPAETPITMADFATRRIEDVRVGDEVLGFVTGKGNKNAYLSKSTVIATGSQIADVYEYQMESDRFLRCTADHLWYSGRNGSDGFHRAYSPLLGPDDTHKGIRAACFVVDPYYPKKAENGWLGGFFDGEGSISNACNLAFTQTNGKNVPVCEALRESLTVFGFQWEEYPDQRGDGQPRIQFVLRGGWETTLDFLRLFRPARQGEIIASLYKHGRKFIKDRDRVVAKRLIGKQPVYWLQTTTGNYVAWGYASKNCQYLNEPVPSDSQIFPLPIVERAFIEESKLPKQRIRFTTLDLAVSQASDADRTAIVTCSVCQGIDQPRPWIVVEHIAAGHFKPLETVEKLYDIHHRYGPVNIKTEDVAFQRLLAPIVELIGRQKNKFLPLTWLKRDTREAKESRIASLQAWFERGDIKILNTVPQREDLVLELTRFPKYRRNDIIDALADQLQNAGFFSAPLQAPLADLNARHGDPRLGLL